MGLFLFDGNNKIFRDLISMLPSGQVYSKDSNIIPYCNNISVTGEGFLAYTDYFNASLYPVGTEVKIYINDLIFDTVEILSNQTIYKKFNTPYGKFKLRTEIGGVTYKDEQWISTNLYTFFMILAQTYNIDYRRLFNIFGNVWDKYLQNDQLFNKVGWYYNFAKPAGWSFNDYRRILTGYNEDGAKINEPMHALFLNGMTEWSIRELCKSFTGIYPTMSSSRDEDGWILPDDTMVSPWQYEDYYILDGVTGDRNIEGVDLNTLTLLMTINGETANVAFTATATASDIVTQINAIIDNTTVDAKAYVRTYEYDTNTYLHIAQGRTDENGEFAEGEFVITGGTAVDLLGIEIGLEIGEMGIVEDGDSDRIATVYNEQYHFNNFVINIRKGIHTVEETVTRMPSSNYYDKLKHRYALDTVLHPFPVKITVGATDYDIGVDYELYTDPDTEYDYIHWITGMSKPADNTTYTVEYTYYIKDDIIPLLEKNKPAFLQVEYEFFEN